MHFKRGPVLQCLCARANIASQYMCVGTGPVDARGVLNAEPAYDEGNEPEVLPRRGEVLLASWFTHKGGANRLWRKFVQRVLSIVISTPGELSLSRQACWTMHVINADIYGKEIYLDVIFSVSTFVESCVFE